MLRIKFTLVRPRLLATTRSRFKITTRNRSCGIVGLPNVGKSTLFNALTKAQLAQASNYPFCTIEPNMALVAVRDLKLIALAKAASSQKIVASQIEFVDIAGLIKGAASGAGLGNKFLANIRQVSVILHVIRCFEDADIIHVESAIDPVQDMETVDTELILADLESIERRAKKNQKVNTSEGKQLDQIYQKCLKCLNEGIPVRDMLWTPEELKLVDSCQLITQKPAIYVCNVDEDSVVNGNDYSRAVESKVKLMNDANIRNGLTSNHYSSLFVSAFLEEEASKMSTIDKNDDSGLELLQMAGLEQTGLERVIAESSRLLGHHSFYTIGPQEAHAWTIPLECRAQDAAGKIHTDISHGFIAAEVIKPDDYLQAKEKNKNITMTDTEWDKAMQMKREGRDYIVQTGDILNFKFNVTKGGKKK